MPLVASVVGPDLPADIAVLMLFLRTDCSRCSGIETPGRRTARTAR